MELLDDIKFWALIILLLPVIFVISIWYWFMVNVIHKDLADEECSLYD
jgi:hypothetical protein